MMIMSSMRKCIGQIAAALVVGAACAAAAGQCPVRFAQPVQSYSAGIGLPPAFAIADFDRDGWVDIAFVAQAVPSLVQVARNQRVAGEFVAYVDWIGQVGPGPSTIAAGDVDGDSLVDLVTANSPGDVSILIGNGDGSFQPEIPRRVGFQPSAVVLADFNSDGRADIVTADWSERTVSVILSLAGRQFSPRTAYDVGYLSESMSVGDANGDGDLDLVVVNGGSQDFSLLLGNGDGSFAPERFFRFGQTFGTAILVDLDNDGRSEIVALYSTPASGRVLGVITLTETGQFQREAFVVVDQNTYGPIVSGDFDGDGNQDVSVNGRVFLGTGNRTLTAVPVTPSTSAGGGDRLQCVDLNADGRPDVMASRSSALHYSLNTSFPVTQQPQSTLACPIRPASFSAAANGTPPYTYRWQYRAVDAIPFDPASWVNLTPGTNTVAGPIGPLEFNAMGTDTGTLTIDRNALLGWPASTLIGSFRCIIGSACGDVITQEAVMTTSDRCSCYDFNSDENVDLLDAQQMAQVFVGLITPQADWLSGDLNADENADLSDAQALAVFVVTGTCGV